MTEKELKSAGLMDLKDSGDTGALPRLSWDETFMAMACVYCMRSPDPHTRHGCVIVDGNIPVGFGYNGFPKGGKNDKIYPLTRPAKYRSLAHSELNSLMNRTLNTAGSTVYVTGHPCSGCIIAMIQGGIKKIIYGNIGSHCVDEEDRKATYMMVGNCDISLQKYDGKARQPYDALGLTQLYLKSKGWM